MAIIDPNVAKLWETVTNPKNYKGLQQISNLGKYTPPTPEPTGLGYEGDTFTKLPGEPVEYQITNPIQRTGGYTPGEINKQVQTANWDYNPVLQKMVNGKNPLKINNLPDFDVSMPGKVEQPKVEQPKVEPPTDEPSQDVYAPALENMQTYGYTPAAINIPKFNRQQPTIDLIGNEQAAMERIKNMKTPDMQNVLDQYAQRQPQMPMLPMLMAGLRQGGSNQNTFANLGESAMQRMKPLQEAWQEALKNQLLNESQRGEAMLRLPGETLKSQAEFGLEDKRDYNAAKRAYEAALVQKGFNEAQAKDEANKAFTSAKNQKELTKFIYGEKKEMKQMDLNSKKELLDYKNKLNTDPAGIPGGSLVAVLRAKPSKNITKEMIARTQQEYNRRLQSGEMKPQQTQTQQTTTTSNAPGQKKTKSGKSYSIE